MKKITTLVFAILLTSLTHAQIKVTDFTEPDLKGHVKQVVEYQTYKADNFNNDTTKYDDKTILTFDTAGIRLTEITINKKFGYLTKNIFIHTDSTIIRNQFDNYGKLNCKYTYKYNSIGKETEFDTQVIASKFMAASTVKIFYSYDDQGNRTEEDQYHDGELMSKDNYLYNDKGQQIERDSQKGAFSQGEKTIFEYDADGNNVKDITYDLDGNKTGETDISYQLIDNNGNWLMRKYENSKYNSKSIILRVITYYQ